MSVTLQVKVNGGAPQTGGVDVSDGDTIQLTAASKAGWAGSPPPRWELSDFPPGFACPAGWSTDGSSGAYYYAGTADPPSFAINGWGKYMLTLTATDAGSSVSDVSTAIRCLSPLGLRSVGRGEGAQFGGERRRWVAELDADLRTLEDTIAVVASGDATAAIVLDRNRSYTASAYLGRVFVGVSDAGHTLGATALVRIPANTISAAADLEIASDLDPDGDIVGGIDVASDQTIAITCVDATGRGRFEASLVGGPATTTALTVSSAVVDAGNANALVVTCSAPCHMPDITGLSLSFTSGTARTITAVEAVSADATAWTLTLSGNMAGDEVCSLTVGTSRTARALNGSFLTVGSTSVTFSGYDYDWSALANDSLWLRADSGIGVADGAAMSSGWTGRNPPNAYVFSEATNRPTYRATAGINGFPAAEFDGTNDFLTSASMTVANMLGAASTAFFVAAAVKIDAVDTTSGATYTNDAIFSDDVGYVGLHLTYFGGNYLVVAYVYDSSIKAATYSLGPSLPAGGVILHMRLSGGDLYAGANGSEGTPVACGAVNAAANGGLVRIGRSSGAHYFDGQIAELVAIQSGTLQSAGIAAMLSKYT